MILEQFIFIPSKRLGYNKESKKIIINKDRYVQIFEQTISNGNQKTTVFEVVKMDKNKLLYKVSCTKEMLPKILKNISKK